MEEPRNIRSKIGSYYHKHSVILVIILISLLLAGGAWVLRVKLAPYRGLFPTDNLGRQSSNR